MNNVKKRNTLKTNEQGIKHFINGRQTIDEILAKVSDENHFLRLKVV